MAIFNHGLATMVLIAFAPGSMNGLENDPRSPPSPCKHDKWELKFSGNQTIERVKSWQDCGKFQKFPIFSSKIVTQRSFTILALSSDTINFIVGTLKSYKCVCHVSFDFLSASTGNICQEVFEDETQKECYYWNFNKTDSGCELHQYTVGKNDDATFGRVNDRGCTSNTSYQK